MLVTYLELLPGKESSPPSPCIVRRGPHILCLDHHGTNAPLAMLLATFQGTLVSTVIGFARATHRGSDLPPGNRDTTGQKPRGQVKA